MIDYSFSYFHPIHAVLLPSGVDVILSLTVSSDGGGAIRTFLKTYVPLSFFLNNSTYSSSIYS
ncbi:hypothetical protein SERLA73DRAFT_183741, partial [Serpula lacrymans var. lacrymans S7.3]